MTVWAGVRGGYSYAVGDREAYRSIAEVLADLWCETDREHGSRASRPRWGDWARDDYAALIFASPEADYPSRVVRVGPRGGLSVEPAEYVYPSTYWPR